jgi:hypothetical protein
MENGALVNPEEINKVYSKQEYNDHLGNKKISSRVPLYALHYMIALDLSPSACVKYAEEHKVCLASRDSELYFVTPLMLAILLGKKKIVEGLAELMTEEDFLVVDEFGFNALHIASLALPDVVNLLKKKSDPLQLTPWGGNYLHLSVLAGYIPPEKSKSRFQVMDKSGNFKDGSLLSSEDLQSLTGLQEVRDLSLYDSSEGRRFLWQQQKPLTIKEQTIFQTFFDSKVREYNLSPPKFIVKPTSKLLLSKLYLGLFADEKISPFTKLSRYGGRFTQSSESFYVFNRCDGRDVGGLATFANCGFPNSIYIMNHYDGDEHKDLYSIRDLSPGEEILVSYGNSYIPFKFGKQVLLGVDEAESFFKHFKANLKKSIDIYKELAESETSNTTLLEQTRLALQQQIYFPLHYPNYLLHLWAKTITSAQSWIDAIDAMDAMSEKNVPDMKTTYDNYKIPRIQCKILLELEALEKQDQWGYIPTLKRWILERIGKFSYIQLFCATSITKEELQTRRLNNDNFSDFFESLPHVSQELMLENCKGSELLKYL